MTKEEIIKAFIDEMETTYGKLITSDITVARAVEVLKDILDDDNYVENYNKTHTDNKMTLLEGKNESNR